MFGSKTEPPLGTDNESRLINLALVLWIKMDWNFDQSKKMTKLDQGTNRFPNFLTKIKPSSTRQRQMLIFSKQIGANFFPQAVNYESDAGLESRIVKISGQLKLKDSVLLKI